MRVPEDKMVSNQRGSVVPRSARRVGPDGRREGRSYRPVC